MLKRISLLLTAVLLIGLITNAQVTTSSLTGTVKDPAGQPLAGATVIAVHQPSGTRYSSTSGSNGQFTITNMRVGGPYDVTVTYVGMEPLRFSDVTLRLAESFVLDANMRNAAAAMENIVVSTTGRSNVMNSKRTGAVTNVGRREIERLPSVSRTISDMTRLTPQGGSNVGTSSQSGVSIGGGNYRQNYITVDGSDFNNAFGIGGNLPAGGAPISLDALEEISVNVTPFDVRQSGFIGSSINAVTRAGTNNLQGSAYYFWTNEKLQGTQVGKESFTLQRRDFQQLGARIGGPIIKNKLFFFLNYEDESDIRPGQTKFAATADRPFGQPNVARPTATELDAISTYLKDKYGYETGPYQGYDFSSPRTKYLARIDWNISNNHRLNLRYSNVQSKTPSFVSTSTGSAGSLTPAVSGNRQDNNALHFKNTNYFQENNFVSYAAELNSTFGKVGNTLRISRNNQNEPRSTESTVFPFVDIMSGNTFFTSFGYEPFSYGNLRDVVIYSATDNATWSWGKHTMTAGAQFDFTDTKNGFQPYGASYYRFGSWNDLVNGAKPLDYTVTYSLLPNFAQAYPRFKFAQYAAYLQDEVALSTKFRVTLGLRADLTTYPNVEEVRENPLVSALNFEGSTHINTGHLPKSTISLAPRVGFNWDVNGDRSFQIRGGTGIFTGRVPFVWIVGQSGNSGMLQVTQNWNGQTNTPGPFNPDPLYYVKQLYPNGPPAAGTVIPSTVTAFAEDFKMPQAWKTSIGFDKRLPWGLVGSLEAIYNKDIRVLYSRNVNLVNPVPMNISGYPDNRLIYPNFNTEKYLNPIINSKPVAPGTRPNPNAALSSTNDASAFSAIVTGNEDRGYYFSTTARLEKQFSRGFFAQIAYTFSDAQSLMEGGGDQPINTWNLVNTVNGANNPELGAPFFIAPHRVVGAVSYKREFLKHLATTVSIFYEGATQGRFSYLYSGDMNRDGGSNNDLIYIPKDPSEIDFVSNTVNGVTYSAQQQEDLFFQYVKQDPYLSKHMGQYAERNGVLLPWRNQFDLKFAQDIFTTVGGKRNTLQFTADIMNFGNLLNSSWGAGQTPNVGFGGQILILQNAASLTPGGTTRPTFRLANDRNHPITETFRTNVGTSSTYFLQFGLRYIFGQ